MFGGGQLGGSMAGSTVVERNLDRLTVITGDHLHASRRCCSRFACSPPDPPRPAVTGVHRGCGTLLYKGWSLYKVVGLRGGSAVTGNSRARCSLVLLVIVGLSAVAVAPAGAERHRRVGRARPASGTIRIAAEEEPTCADWIASVRGLVVGQLDAREPDAAAGVLNVSSDGEYVPGADARRCSRRSTPARR